MQICRFRLAAANHHPMARACVRVFLGRQDCARVYVCVRVHVRVRMYDNAWGVGCVRIKVCGYVCVCIVCLCVGL